MDQTQIIDLVREAIMLTIQISAPPLIVGLVVGVAIALVQALTQIQEMTLVFVPKILAIFLSIFVLFPVMVEILRNYMQSLADLIVGM